MNKLRFKMIQNWMSLEFGYRYHFTNIFFEVSITLAVIIQYRQTVVYDSNFKEVPISKINYHY